MQRFYIGDVHGYPEPLELLLNEISRNYHVNDVCVNFIGDLVDRGPDSRAVLQLVLNAKNLWPDCHLHLGNHDQKFRSVIKEGARSESMTAWLRYGGEETLASYQVDRSRVNDVSHLYPEHLRLLSEACLYRLEGSFISAHAGIGFDIPIEQQSEETLCWIRDSFLDHVDPAAPVVIHGHTIVGDYPVITENRISIDTGIYRSGRLTCCLIDDDINVEFLQACDGELKKVAPEVIDRGYGTILDRKDLTWTS